MNTNSLVATLAVAVVAIFAIGPIDTLAFVLQMGGTGAAIGTVIALWRSSRNRDFPIQLLLLRWTVVGLAIGVLIVLGTAVR